MSTSPQLQPKAIAAAALALLACLLLVACGGPGSSSTGSAAARGTTATSAAPGNSSSTASTPSTATSSATRTQPAQARAKSKQFAALRECLRKNGGLPSSKAGQAGGVLGARSGAQQQKLRAALRKCGVHVPKTAPSQSATTSKSNLASIAAFRKALTEFASCMRQKGIKLPEPNLSGKGQVFNTRGLDTTSAQYKAAQTACAAALRARFKAKAGTSGSSGGR
jgi:hypothetical protein